MRITIHKINAYNTKMTNKDMLFYSNYCQFSKEILVEITKNNIRHNLLLICVDSGKYKIPHCITTVPSILSGDLKKMYIDDQIYGYIKTHTQVLQKQKQPQQNRDLQTFSWEGNSLSESYSFLSSPDTNEDGNMSSKMYTFLNEDTHNKSFHKFAEDDDTLKQSKFDMSSYDAYISNRNRDEESIKRKVQNVNYMDRIM